jgi:hypothetical protein
VAINVLDAWKKCQRPEILIDGMKLIPDPRLGGNGIGMGIFDKVCFGSLKIVLNDYPNSQGQPEEHNHNRQIAENCICARHNISKSCWRIGAIASLPRTYCLSIADGCPGSK